jgi:hypothetical protein
MFLHLAGRTALPRGHPAPLHRVAVLVWRTVGRDDPSYGDPLTACRADGFEAASGVVDSELLARRAGSEVCCGAMCIECLAESPDEQSTSYRMSAVDGDVLRDAAQLHRSDAFVAHAARCSHRGLADEDGPRSGLRRDARRDVDRATE